MTNTPRSDGTATVRTIFVARSEDILAARQGCRDVAQALDLTTVDQTRLATVISELARNALRYGGGGVCRIHAETDDDGRLLRLEMEDHGPGIADIAAALEPGFSTGGGYGLGLPAVKRLMDRFTIESRPGRTVVTAEMRRRTL